jgi:hypothetical protein
MSTWQSALSGPTLCAWLMVWRGPLAEAILSDWSFGRLACSDGVAMGVQASFAMSLACAQQMLFPRLAAREARMPARLMHLA